MYTVMIVDDEPMIRDGLQTLIPWEEHGFIVTATAKNGKEALERYEQHPPNVMIVDIRMPQMDGLTLIRKIRQKNKDIFFLILSGYAEFEYAKQAIRSSVIGYLLKPLDEDELIENLEKIKKQLCQSEQIASLQEQNTLAQAFFLADPGTLRSYIPKEEEISRYQILLIQSIQNGIVRPALREWRPKFEKAVTHLGIVFVTRDYLGLLLIKPVGERETHILSYTEIVDILGTTSFVVAYGEDTYRYVHIKQSYLTATQLLANYFYLGQREIIKKNERLLPQTTLIANYQMFQIDGYIEKLQYALEMMDLLACETILGDFREEARKLLLAPDIIQASAVKLYTGALRTLAPLINDAVLAEFLDEIGDLVHLSSLPKIVEVLLEKCRRITSVLGEEDQHLPVKKVVHMIQNHYQKPLKLETFAEVLNYNSAYLGKLFRDYTGVYFNTFVDQVRIEKGKELLAEGLKVYEVAEQVGYANVDYFHKKFKQYEGISPSQFRKKLRR